MIARCKEISQMFSFQIVFESCIFLDTQKWKHSSFWQFIPNIEQFHPISLLFNPLILLNEKQNKKSKMKIEKRKILSNIFDPKLLDKDRPLNISYSLFTVFESCTFLNRDTRKWNHSSSILTIYTIEYRTISSNLPTLFNPSIFLNKK